jgi:anti-sigma-K factor RskA
MADLRRQVEQADEASTEMEQQQRQQMQTIVQQVTNYQQRVADLQTQLSQRNQDYQRETTRLYDQLKQTTNQLQFQRVPLLRQIQEQQNMIEDLQDAASQVTVPSSDRFAQTSLEPLLPTTNAPPRAAAAAAFDLISQQGVLEVQDLPPLQVQDYQLWLFDPRFSTPVSAGIFGTDAQGRARYQYRSTFNLQSVAGFAISVERKGGSPAPQGPIVMVTH